MSEGLQDHTPTLGMFAECGAGKEVAAAAPRVSPGDQLCHLRMQNALGAAYEIWTRAAPVPAATP